MRILERVVRLVELFCLSAALSAIGQTATTPSQTSPAPPPLPPATSQFPPRLNNTNAGNPRPVGLTPVARTGPVSAPVAQRPLPPAPLLKPLPLVWESEVKEYVARPGDTNVNLVFSLTNNTPDEVVINQVHTSCGCTVARLPSTPWNVAPGTNGQIQVTVDLRGKRGLLVKTVTVYSTAYAPKQLTLKVSIPEPPAGPMGDRSRNLQIASADRQAVFRNDCATCHAVPAVGKKGAELYAAACGVCHEAEHRASMVPDLRTLNHSTDRIYWKVWAAQGKAGSLMPGFSKTFGGPLDEEQIESLADYLVEYIPTRSAAAQVAPGAK